MKNIFVYLITLLFIVSSFNSKNGKIIITGIITGYPDSTKVLLNNLDTQSIVDTTYLINNQFNFKVSVTESAPHVIIIENPSAYETLFLWLENVDVSVVGNRDKFSYAQVEGGEIQNQVNNLSKITDPLNIRFDSINVELRKSYEEKELEKAKLLKEQLNKVIEDRIAKGTIYIMENPDYLFSAFNLKNFVAGLPKSKVKELYDNLSPEVKESDYAKSVLKYLELSKNVKIGDIAENFQLPDLDRNKVSLKDFKGKYVLLEFWKSACKPCRIENKTLLTNYTKYKSKGFEIISITTDRNKNSWELATIKDSIIWTSLQDFKSENGRVGNKYNVKFIPSNFLIDPKGRIIAMNLKGEKLGEKLREIFTE